VSPSAATGGAIISAGAVLAGTFTVLGTLLVIFLTELGFAVAFGVLLDTILVRPVLVTALKPGPRLAALVVKPTHPASAARKRSPEAEIAGERAAVGG
jgi:RND superfamily putative drug exporter